MSDEDPNANRTVFRPSPLQALRDAQSRPAPDAAPPPPADAEPLAATGFAPAPAAAPARRLNDDDIPQPPEGPRPRNPLMTAAAPTLALIASVRAARVQVALPQLHREASAAMTAFDQAIARFGYPEEQRQRARYAVAATIDDVAQNLPGQELDAAEWARRSMVVQVFQENIGGDRFWQLLDDMLARPAEYGDLIELYHACLAAGFEGRYRVMPDGKSRLLGIMTGAYAVLEHARKVSPLEISPHWKGTPAPLQKVGFWAPLALAAGIALAVLLLLYIVLRLILAQTGQPSLQALRDLNPGQPLSLSRAAAPPPVQSGSQTLRLQQFLAPEIAQHLVKVDQDASSVRVRTTVGQLFRSGSDQLEPGRRALFERIAAGVETEPGDVRVEGHADSDRAVSISFPDNLALSKARATAVAAIVREKLSNPGRVSAEGFGDSQPIASNATAEGKALNRRVEIVIPRKE
jgi:type VI secretion system peptidoglycan-associated protein